MNIRNLDFLKNNSSNDDIRSHLERCDMLFKPLLSSYINLDTYSKKLSEKANRYEVFCESELIGLVAVYISNDVGFISNFSVEKELVGKGVASDLMKFCIEDFKRQNIAAIRLEVFKENERAIKFYNKYGFIIEKEDSLRLTLVKIV